MATTVKVTRDFGIDGRLMHKHGDSGWHPAHRSHAGGTKFYAADSHEANEADKPTNAKEVLTTPELRQAYEDCLNGIEQPAFAAKWEEKKASMRAKREAEKAATPEPEAVTA